MYTHNPQPITHPDKSLARISIANLFRIFPPFELEAATKVGLRTYGCEVKC